MAAYRINLPKHYLRCGQWITMPQRSDFHHHQFKIDAHKFFYDERFYIIFFFNSYFNSTLSHISYWNVILYLKILYWPLSQTSLSCTRFLQPVWLPVISMKSPTGRSSGFLQMTPIWQLKCWKFLCLCWWASLQACGFGLPKLFTHGRSVPTDWWILGR